MGIHSLFRSKTEPKDQFERIIRPHVEGLYRFAFRLCPTQNDAEELVQLLLTRLFPKIDQLQTIENLKPWLARSLYNLYIDTYRKAQREAALFINDAATDQAPGTDFTPYEQADQTQKSQLISNALQRLNPNQRTVVLLHDSEGYTLKELELILDTPIGTLKSRLNRARTLLRDLLSMEPFAEASRSVNMKEEVL